MQDSFKLVFNIRPQVKERARFNTRSGHAFTPSKTRTFEKFIKEQARFQWQIKHKQEVFTGLCSLYVEFNFKKPKKTKLETPRGDTSNMLKALEDGLNGVVYKDDVQAFEVYACKRWAECDCIKVTIVKL